MSKAWSWKFVRNVHLSSYLSLTFLSREVKKNTTPHHLALFSKNISPESWTFFLFLWVFSMQSNLLSKQKLSSLLKDHKSKNWVQRMSREQKGENYSGRLGRDWNFRFPSKVSPCSVCLSPSLRLHVRLFLLYDFILSQITVIWLNYNINWNNFPAKLNGMKSHSHKNNGASHFKLEGMNGEFYCHRDSFYTS